MTISLYQVLTKAEPQLSKTLNYILKKLKTINTKNHRPLSNDPTKKKNNDTVNKTIKTFEKEHLINDRVAEGLIIQNARTIQRQIFPLIEGK